MKKTYVLIATPVREESWAGVEADSVQEAVALLGARLVKQLTKGGKPFSREKPSYEIDFSLEEVEKDEQWVEIPARHQGDRLFQRKGAESLEISFYRFSYTNDKEADKKLALSCCPFKLEELPLIKKT